MKSAQYWHSEWAFGSCPHAPFPAQSISCGQCLRDTIAAAQREARREALKEAAQLVKDYATHVEYSDREGADRCCVSLLRHVSYRLDERALIAAGTGGE